MSETEKKLVESPVTETMAKRKPGRPKGSTGKSTAKRTTSKTMAKNRHESAAPLATDRNASTAMTGIATRDNDNPAPPATVEFIRKNYNNSPVIGEGGVNTLPGDNSRYAAVLYEIYSWGDVNKSSVPDMDARFRKTVNYCIDHDVRITNKLIYLGIGISKDDVYNWSNGHTRDREHSDFINKIKNFCSTYREMLGAEGKLNPTTLIWWQKNYDGFVDRNEIVVTPNQPNGEIIPVEQIADKYKDLPED